MGRAMVYLFLLGGLIFFTGCLSNQEKDNGLEGKTINDATGVEPIPEDDIAPFETSIVINQGNSSTDVNLVLLALAANDDEGVIGYYLSEDVSPPVSSSQGWIIVPTILDFQKTVGFYLSSTSEEKTLYAWFKDEAGNISTEVDDSIILLSDDTIAPVNEMLSINSGAVDTNSTTVSLTLSAEDNKGVTGYFVSESSTLPENSDSGWALVTSAKQYSGVRSYITSSQFGSKTLYVWYRDAAGNISDLATAGINYIDDSDSTPPEVALPMVPADSATNIPANSSFSVTFNESMETTTITANTGGTTCSGWTVQLSADNFISCIQMSADPVPSNGNKTFTLTPASDLVSLTTYKIRVTTAANDIADNALVSTVTQTNGFTTTFVDTVAPTISSISPIDGTTGVSTESSSISIIFDEAINTTTLTVNTSDTSCTGTIQISSSANNFSTCLQMLATPTPSNGNKTFTVSPTATLSTTTWYKIRITTDAQDMAGNALETTYTTTTGFQTGTGPAAQWDVDYWDTGYWN